VNFRSLRSLAVVVMVISMSLVASAAASAKGLTFMNKHSGKVLEVSGWSNADGAKIGQWTWAGGQNQRWTH